jgi:hypothetical protein
MPTYDATNFDPPAPVALVTLRSVDTGISWSDVRMLLDSGADISMIPQAALQRLGVTPVPNKRYELMGFDGTVSFAEVVRLELIFDGRIFRGQFLLLSQEMGVLGRNVLNALSLLYDGPRLTWRELLPE